MYRAFFQVIICGSIILFASNCTSEQPSGSLFTSLSKNKTNIDFRNLIREDENFNIFQYQYYYNGGGCAAGDFNNDGLNDLVFTGNMVKNRLYINQGDMEFHDGTKRSGIAKKEGWCTGVTPVDINADGWLDLYICRAGYPFDDLRRNLLFVNNGDPDKSGTPTFTEKATEYGLDDFAHSTHSAFFDYDNDGDLDLFLMNQSTVEYSRGSLEVFPLREKKNPDFTNKLYRNNGNGAFENVTAESNITSNVLSFSLGLNITDLNGDGWQDIFIGNDFNEPDYLFINQKDGTFSEELSTWLDHTSMYSMGSDFADINNDGLLDFVSLDMLPESNLLQKTHSGADNFDKVSMLEKNGFFKQYSRNMLQLNNGDGSFSEVAQLAGVSNTDWSWSALFFDFENDGLKDLFISNGYLRDHTDMDFLKFTADQVLKIDKGEEHVNFEEYLAAMPPINQPNYFFKNTDGIRFENMTAEWGLDAPVVSQGAVYADLDNDGDFDVVTNNSGEYAHVYQNNAESFFENNYLRIKFLGQKENPIGIGSKVWVHAQGKTYFQEQHPVRGFQASVDPILCFGLGSAKTVDSIRIVWPLGQLQILTNIASNQTLKVTISEAREKHDFRVEASPKIFIQNKNAIDFSHRENDFNDFKSQALLPWSLSRQGPCVAVADVNGDGRDDLFLGNASGSTGKIFIQKTDGTYAVAPNQVFEKDAISEDVDASFFDADGDGAPDLIVASGSYDATSDARSQPRLYLNDGRGHFKKSENRLPNLEFGAAVISPADVDADGDTDLFLGGGYLPRRYPQTARSLLLLNDGKGKFSPGPTTALDALGHVNDALWLDLNGDSFPELITLGEWSPIKVFENKNGKLSEHTEKYIPLETSGLWNSIYAADFDEDGDIDLVAGNLGLNSQLSASESEPLEIYVGDFDENETIDPIITYFVQGKSYPLASLDDMVGQLPPLRKRFLFYKDYAETQIGELLTAEQLANAERGKAVMLESIFLENENGIFNMKKLPIPAQVAPVEAITSMDVNSDGHLDMVVAGNRSFVRVKLGRLDGLHSLVFLGDGKGGFSPMPARESGLKVREDVRFLEKVELNGKEALFFGVNNGGLKIFEKLMSK